MKCFIGIGSNLGTPSVNLENAALALRELSPAHFRISPAYHTAALLPEKAPTEWDLTYHNAVVEIDWTESPEDLLRLLKSIEIKLGRTAAPNWAPRIIDLDLLTFGQEIYQSSEIQIPHQRILERAFVLDPMKDLDPSYVLPGMTDSILFQARKLPRHQPLIMGVINITPDSFSDGGNIKNNQDFENLIKQMDSSGTQIIDIGAESTRPGALFLTAEQEWTRLEPALNFVKNYFSNRLIKPLISVDTYKSEIAHRALEYNVDIINDVSGMSDNNMVSVLAGSKCQYILMHSLGLPPDPNAILPADSDPVKALKIWLEEKLIFLESHDIDSNRVIFDIGIGFGKSSNQSLELLERIDEFTQLPIRILVGHSRKSFMKDIAKHQSVEIPSTRDAITLSFSYKLAKQGVDILRVHDFLTHMEAFV